MLVVTRCWCWDKLSKCWNWRNLIAENITDLHRVGTGIVIVIIISKMVKRLIIMIFKVMMTIPGNVTGSCRGRRHWAGGQRSASQPEDYSWWWGMALFCKLNVNCFWTTEVLTIGHLRAHPFEYDVRVTVLNVPPWVIMHHVSCNMHHVPWSWQWFVSPVDSPTWACSEALQPCRLSRTSWKEYCRDSSLRYFVIYRY